MAWIERRGRRFRIKFGYGDRNFQVTLGTDDEVEAEQDLPRFRENLRLLERDRLTLTGRGSPPGDTGAKMTKGK